MVAPGRCIVTLTDGSVFKGEQRAPARRGVIRLDGVVQVLRSGAHVDIGGHVLIPQRAVVTIVVKGPEEVGSDV